MTGPTDLFGDNESQGDLFGEIEQTQQPIYRPDPDKVRRRLQRILAEARSAETMPWDGSKQRLYQQIFPQMTNWLPEEEAKQFCFEFEQEMERLKAA